MKPPEFFARLRAEVVALRDTGRPRVDAFFDTTESRADLSHGNGRMVRLDELMTQAALGADIPITPGETACDVWVAQLVDYGKRTGRLHMEDGSVRDTDWPDGFDEPVTRSSESVRWITDVFGLAEDWLVHLETLALAASQQERKGSSGPLTYDVNRAYKLIGPVLKEYYRRCGHTVETLATEVDVPERTVRRHVNSRQVPKAQTLKKYAEEFSKRLNIAVTPDDLLREALEPSRRPAPGTPRGSKR